ncbi:hypothetical protein [Phenylobacterium sp.]|uniref:hypothetical protein n=1 Tax=Phenylobacterium sp. TaxID=1871053 RepID=UPI0039378FE1
MITTYGSAAAAEAGVAMARPVLRGLTLAGGLAPNPISATPDGGPPAPDRAPPCAPRPGWLSGALAGRWPTARV